MGDDFVTVCHCHWLHEAYVVRSVLEAADIYVLIPDEYTVRMRAEWATALGGIRVMVRDSDAERALELLSHHRK